MKLHQKFSKLFLLIVSLFLLSGMSVFIGANININPYGLDNNNLPEKEILTEPKDSWTNSYQDIRPNGDISNNGFILVPVGGALYEKIDEVSPEDTDYIYVTNTGYDCELAMGNLNLVTGQTVTGIRVYVRGNMIISMGDPWQASIDWRIGTGSYSTADSVQFGSSWGWRSTSLWSGLSLSESQINNLRIRISIIGNPDTQMLGISTMYAEITIRSNEAPTVDLTSPNGGEILQDTTIITWTYEDPEGQSITFDLFYDLAGTEIWTPIVSGLVNEISYMWDLSGFNQTQNQVRVKIEASDGYGGNDEDVSHGYFTILASHNIVVNLISPNGGEILQDTTNITWTYEDPEGQPITFNIFYNLAGSEIWTPIVYGLVDEISYEWNLSGFNQTQDEVRVGIEASDGYERYDNDVSHEYFTILASHNIVVNLISPNGGEILQETMSITWTYYDIDGDDLIFSLFYDLAGTEIWNLIVSGLVNEDIYEWDLSGFTQTQGEVRVKVEVVDGNNEYDEDVSDYSFVIYVKREEGETISSFYISIIGASTCIIGVFLSINIIKRKRKKSTIV